MPKAEAAMKAAYILALLCAYGFFKSFKPLEPFLTPYLTMDKNFTDTQVSQQIYPVWTYTYAVVLIPVFVLSDLFRYKIVIIGESLCYVTTWVLLIWGYSTPLMQMMQFAYGCGTAMEVAFYAYMYAALDSDLYKKSTTYVKSCCMIGKFSAYCMSQALVTILKVDFLVLNYITLASMILTFLLALLYPTVSWRSDKSLDQLLLEPVKKQLQDLTYFDYVKLYFRTFFKRFKQNYTDKFIWKWSLWWALATCGFLQVGNYVQTLWLLEQFSQADVYNGVAHGANTLLGAIVVFLMQYVKMRLEIWGELVMACVALLDCFVLVLMGYTDSLVLSYCCYSVSKILYQITIVITMFNLAKKLTTESYGLVFGFNTFMALVLQSLLTLLVADKLGFALEIRTQFLVYGAYHGLIAVVFLAMGLQTSYKRRREAFTGSRRVKV